MEEGRVDGIGGAHYMLLGCYNLGPACILRCFKSGDDLRTTVTDTDLFSR